MKTTGSKSLQASAMLAVAAELDRHGDNEHGGARGSTEIPDGRIGAHRSIPVTRPALHSLLARLPISFVAVALSADIALALTSDPLWADAAVGMIGAAFAAGVCAMFTASFTAVAASFRGGFAAWASWGRVAGDLAGLSLVTVDLAMRMSDPDAPVLPFGPVLTAAALAVLVAVFDVTAAPLRRRAAESPAARAPGHDVVALPPSISLFSDRIPQPLQEPELLELRLDQAIRGKPSKMAKRRWPRTSVLVGRNEQESAMRTPLTTHRQTAQVAGP